MEETVLQVQQKQENAGMKSTLNLSKLDKDGRDKVISNDGKKPVDCKWWIRVSTYTIFMLAGQTTGVLLGRLYYDKGGNSPWTATLVHSAGFPILIPFFVYFSRSKPSSSFPRSSASSPSGPPLSHLVAIYLMLGLLTMGHNLMYSYGQLYIPVSTYSLLCATQLAFSVVFSIFLNSQKLTMLILNSVVLLTISAVLLALNSESEATTSTFSKAKYPIGFVCTLGASATYSLFLSLVQLTFDKVIKRSQTFDTSLDMQFFPALFATLASIVGLLASREWRELGGEIGSYKGGKGTYVMILAGIAVSWQVAVMGMVGLIFEVSSLFSNVISTLSLPLVPVLAVMFFHDKMNGVKVISLVLALWGFCSYIYQHYLDDAKHRKAKVEVEAEDKVASAIEIF